MSNRGNKIHVKALLSKEKWPAPGYIKMAPGDTGSPLLRQARDRFVARFGRAPVAAASAPGRVNLIGDHVDYCDGFVLPAALQFSTLVVGGPNNSSTCNILSILESGQELETSFDLPVSKDTKVPAWASYVIGVVYYFPGLVQGFDAVLSSDVPMGSGLSSSAALEVSTFTFLEALTGTVVEPAKKALACQKAEHEFAGMPCGIMDQFISTLGKKGHALLIDCRSLEATHIPVTLSDVTILVVNSNVKHQLTGSEYPQRRAQCQQAALLLASDSLRDSSTKDVENPNLSKELGPTRSEDINLENQMEVDEPQPVAFTYPYKYGLKHLDCEPEVLKRAEHVVSEICRTEAAAISLKGGNLDHVGKLFFESHRSMSELMEVSCPELDQIVEVCRRAPGVLGARMTGGGFGGCVVTLVRKENVEDLKSAIKSQFDGNPTFFICQPSDGAKIIDLKTIK